MKKLIFLLLLSITLSGCSLFGGEGSKILGKPNSVTMWIVIDSPADFASVTASYNAIFPNITVTIKKLRLEDYEEELLNALAEDRGPDIFMVHNTALRKYLSKIESLPPQIMLPQAISTGTLKKEIIVKQTTSNTVTALDVRNKFVEVVADDVIIENEIYSLPLYLDTMALYYNRDLLNNAGIAQPPRFWDQFQAASAQLTKINADNEIIQSGSALGSAKNIANAPDILAVLMLQNGVEMYSENKTAAAFQRQPEGTTGNPAAEALRFYSDFALPQTTAYTWNAKRPDNLEAFSSGQLAFFLGYAYQQPIIKSQTLGKLNFSIAPLPQIQGREKANIASYWTPVVSKKSENIDAAWSFIQHIASPANVPKYLLQVKKPSALRELVDADADNPDLFAFSGQSLNAKNWYYGMDPKNAKGAFEDMITEALRVDPTLDRLQELKTIINNAAIVINQSYR